MNGWFKEYLLVSLWEHRRANLEALDLMACAGSTTPWFWPNFLEQNQGFLNWHDLTDPVQREMRMTMGENEQLFDVDRWRKAPATEMLDERADV